MGALENPQELDDLLPAHQQVYGVPDIEQYAAGVSKRLETTPALLPIEIMNLMAAAQTQIDDGDAVKAQQSLNRARFLITRLCPILKEFEPSMCTTACGCRSI